MKNKPIQKIMDDRFGKRLSDKEIDNELWSYAWVTNYSEDRLRESIQNKIDCGHRVKCGYTATGVRGYHQFIMMWKASAPTKKEVDSL